MRPGGQGPVGRGRWAGAYGWREQSTRENEAHTGQSRERARQRGGEDGPAGARRASGRRPGPGPVCEDTWATSWLTESRDESQIPPQHTGPAGAQAPCRLRPGTPVDTGLAGDEPAPEDLAAPALEMPGDSLSAGPRRAGSRGYRQPQDHQKRHKPRSRPPASMRLQDLRLSLTARPAPALCPQQCPQGLTLPRWAAPQGAEVGAGRRGRVAGTQDHTALGARRACPGDSVLGSGHTHQRHPGAQLWVEPQGHRGAVRRALPGPMAACSCLPFSKRPVSLRTHTLPQNSAQVPSTDLLERRPNEDFPAELPHIATCLNKAGEGASPFLATALVPQT